MSVMSAAPPSVIGTGTIYDRWVRLLLFLATLCQRSSNVHENLLCASRGGWLTDARSCNVAIVLGEWQPGSPTWEAPNSPHSERHGQTPKAHDDGNSLLAQPTDGRRP